MTPGRILLVLGGVRAGKSAYALARAAERGERVAFVATAEPRDPEMAARIARHRAARPPHWTTVEAPVALVEKLGGPTAVSCLSPGPAVSPAGALPG